MRRRSAGGATVGVIPAPAGALDVMAMLAERSASSLRPGDLAQGGEDAVYLVLCVVVDGADAQRAAVLLQAEALHQVEGVVVAVPDEDAAGAEQLGEVARAAALHGEHDGGDAARQVLGAGEAVDADAGDLLQAGDEARGESALVLLNGGHGGVQVEPAAGHAGEALAIAVGVGAAELGEVLQRAEEAGDALVVLRASLPLAGRLVVRGADLVGF